MTRLSQTYRFGRSPLVAFAALAPLLVAGVATAAPAPDAWITTRTKIALITAGGASPGPVHVDTVEGRVTLFGTLATKVERDKLEAIARGLPGVRAVSDQLTIVEVPSKASPVSTSAHIKTEVQQLLRTDPSLAGGHIQVRSVKNGAVVLAGKSVKLSDQLRSIEWARCVSGVKSVASEITSPSNETTEFEASPRRHEIEETVVDDWITRAVKIRLLADSAVPALRVSVDTYRGVVSLFGEVASTEIMQAAEADAKKVKGVTSVDDSLVVVAPTEAKSADVSDDVVKQDVSAAFSTLPDKKHIDVDVKHGVAHLTGTVASGWQSLYAATMAREVKGVLSVDDDLQF